MMAELKRILYAEDEPDIQAVAKIALETVGSFELKICNNGEEALANAVSYAPDLLLFDVMMPGMDGPAAFKAIKELPELADTPVIFMTAKVQPTEVAEYKNMGAIDVIAKPFDPMTLAEQIKTIWQHHYGE